MGITIVTGASRGIGADIARGLAAAGHVVYAGMRRPEGPHELEGAVGDIRPVRLDVTVIEDPARVASQAFEECGRVDAVVNNAGVAWFAPAESMSETVLQTTFDTNFFGAVRCTQAVLPIFRRQGSGRVIMVSTLAAAHGLPLESAYCASKSALEAFSESLREEVRRFGVSVSLIEPGITEGGLSTSVSDPWAAPHPAYKPLIDHTHAFYRRAQVELDSSRLVLAAVVDILDSLEPKLRYPLGALAPLIAELRRTAESDADVMLREALDIEWWGAGQEPPQ